MPDKNDKEKAVSFICGNCNSLGISFDSKNEDMIRVLFDFMECQVAGIESGIMDGIYNCPNNLNEISRRKYLYTESYIDHKRINNLFFELNRFFAETIIVYAEDWSYEETEAEDDDNNDELFGTKTPMPAHLAPP